MADRGWADLAAPVPDMVASSRRHLAERYATGIYRLLWEQEKRPIPDAHAVRAVLSAAATERRVDVLDIGAALVIVQAMRLELDLLEADVFDAAEVGGVPDESVAAVLELPGAAAVTARHQMLSAKRELLRSVPEESVPVRHPEDAREAAGRAGRRAASAASRATEVGRRRERLRRNHDLHAGPTARGSGPEDTEMVSARASEARINSRDANERVALSLLHAADTLDKSAKRYQEQERRTADRRAREQFRRRATEYAQTAELYRKLADHYLRLGEGTR